MPSPAVRLLFASAVAAMAAPATIERGILYENAARFFRITEEDRARHRSLGAGGAGPDISDDPPPNRRRP